MNALKELDTSIDWIEGRKRKSDKTVLQRMRDGTWGQEEKIPNWEPSADSEFNSVDVILRWAGKEITRVRNISKKRSQSGVVWRQSLFKKYKSRKSRFYQSMDGEMLQCNSQDVCSKNSNL